MLTSNCSTYSTSSSQHALRGWNCYSLKSNSPARGYITAAESCFTVGQRETNPSVRSIALCPAEDERSINTSGHRVTIQVYAVVLTIRFTWQSAAFPLFALRDPLSALLAMPYA